MTSGEQIAARFEGLRSRPYLCPAGVATIGRGTIRYPDGRKVTLDDAPITVEQADQYFLHDFAKARRDARRLVGKPLKPDQLEALSDFVYNLGPVALSGSTLLRRLKRGEDFSDQWGRWVKAGGKTMDGLVKRREAEKTLYESA